MLNFSSDPSAMLRVTKKNFFLPSPVIYVPKAPLFMCL
jgi:hypothetical protein